MPALVLWSCVPCLLSALSLCLWCVMLEYGSISHFKGVLAWFLLFRVGLCCLGALRGLCGFCVREWLGGFGACGVFASILFYFLSFCSCFYLVSSFPCLPSCPLLVLFLCGLLFPFPLRTICAKRKGAKVLPLVSSLRVLCVFRYLYSY